MKVVYRILFALLMVLLFWFSFNTANNIVTERYIKEHVEPNLRGDNPDYLYFYGSVPHYNHRIPLYSLETEQYNVKFFELIVADKKGTKLDEYVYVIFHDKTIFETGENYRILIEGEKEQYVFYPQGMIYDVLVLLEDEQVYIKRSYIESTLNKEWKLVDGSDNVLVSFTPTLDRPFELKTVIESYVQANGKLPNNDLNDQNIYLYDQPDYSPYLIVYSVALSIFGVVFALSLFGLYLYDKRKGKRQLMDYESILNERRKSKQL